MFQVPVSGCWRASHDEDGHLSGTVPAPARRIGSKPQAGWQTAGRVPNRGPSGRSQADIPNRGPSGGPQAGFQTAGRDKISQHEGQTFQTAGRLALFAWPGLD